MGLENPMIRPMDYQITFTPQTGTAITIERGTFTMPGTEPGDLNQYVTDIKPYTYGGKAKGLTPLVIETLFDKTYYDTFRNYSLSGISGTITVAGKTGTTVSGESWTMAGSARTVTPGEANSEGGTPVTLSIEFNISSIS